MICAACQQEVGDTGLGTPLPHHLESGEGFCPGFIQAAQFSGPDPLPPPAAIKEPGRKVRSDKGTKRGQRKKGGESHAVLPGVQAAPGGPPSQEPERVAAELAPPPRFDAVYDEALKRMNAPEGETRHDVRPPTKVEDWMKIPKIQSTVLDSTAGDAVPKPHGRHVSDARAGYVATAPDWQPLIHATYAEAEDAATEALRGAAERVIIYRVTPIEEISNGLIRKRLGRVRRGKP